MRNTDVHTRAGARGCTRRDYMSFAGSKRLKSRLPLTAGISLPYSNGYWILRLNWQDASCRRSVYTD
jgi:hypothetical protein